MSMKYKIDDQWVEAPNGYVTESMFFNPRHPEDEYLIKAGDKVLSRTRFGLTWQIIVEGDTAIGKDFKELLKTNPEILLLAIPTKYEFGDDSIYKMSGYFGWGAMGMGFGQLSFYRDEETGKIIFDTECMGPETTRKIMHDLVDFMVDNGVSADWDRRKSDAAEQDA